MSQHNLCISGIQGLYSFCKIVLVNPRNPQEFGGIYNLFHRFHYEDCPKKLLPQEGGSIFFEVGLIVAGEPDDVMLVSTCTVCGVTAKFVIPQYASSLRSHLRRGQHSQSRKNTSIDPDGKQSHPECLNALCTFLIQLTVPYS